jgi:hypothetical protein
MRVRHRIPSIFSLSMVDMLCCCMGCIILVWLLGAKQSEDNIHDAKAALEKQKQEANAELAKLDAQIADLALKRDAAMAEVEAGAASFGDLERKWKNATGQITSLKADVAAREKDLAAAGGRIKDLQALADLVPGLRTQLKTSQDQYAADEAKVLAMEKDAGLRAKELDETTRKLLAARKDADQRALDLDDVGKKLTGLQAVKTKLESDLEDRGKELTLLRPLKDKYAADEEQLLSLKKDLLASRKELGRRSGDLDDVGKKFVALQLAKTKLESDLEDRAKELADARHNADAMQAEKARWQTEAAKADNRFAGITLTGRRVVFLVDMSGSMVYLDDNTPAPQKWVEVHKTVARIMRSLPDLEKYQIVAFSDKPHFPLGSDGKWLDYDPKASPDLVLQTLADVKPDGGTNMYSAMETTFRYRRDGLDTVYLLSDGLPNLGEGVRPEEVEKLTELERGARLSAVIRKALKDDWNRDLNGKPRVHINTVGFFYESPDVGAFLWALARENDGSFVGMSKP